MRNSLDGTPRCGYMKYRRCIDGLIVVLLGFGCMDPQVGRKAGPSDSAAPMLPSPARQDAQQWHPADSSHPDSVMERALRHARAQREAQRPCLIVERATVMAFLPITRLKQDSATLRQRLSQYERVARDAGWAFAECSSDVGPLIDPASQALYSLPLPRDSFGLVAAAPGYRPEVWFGHITEAALRERLRAFDALRGKGRPRPAGL
jgi:hypothetical protein